MFFSLKVPNKKSLKLELHINHILKLYFQGKSINIHAKNRIKNRIISMSIKQSRKLSFLAYGGLGDSSGMRHICSRGRCSLLHGDIGTSRITADQVCPATPANHSFLLNNPTHRCFVNPRAYLIKLS